MENQLYYKIEKAKFIDNKEYVEEIIKMFMPIIQKYSTKLNFDGADTDLIISLIKIIKSLPNLKEDKIIISYINVSIKHEYIRLSKKYNKIIKTELPLDEYIYQIPLDDDENLFILYELLDKLPQPQGQLLKEIFINGSSEISLANKLNISRQAVNKALENLRKYIEI